MAKSLTICSLNSHTDCSPAASAAHHKRSADVADQECRAGATETVGPELEQTDSCDKSC